jgi:hypothetical protein
MASVSFRLEFKTDELRALDLPVEVRKTNSTLIARALSSQTVDLPPGKYYATACLPAGQRLISPFEIDNVSAGTSIVVTLAPDPEDESPHEWEEVSHYLARPAASGGQLVRDTPPPPIDDDAVSRSYSPSFEVARTASSGGPLLRLFSGNVVQRTHAPLSTVELGPPQGETGRIVQFELPRKRALLIAQLATPGGRVQNMTLPVSPMAGLRLVIGRDPDGGFRMDAYLEHSAANMLLLYAASGLASTTDAASRSASVNGERLLRDKMGDPIAAAVGAYALLRVGALDRLHDWTSFLRGHFEWLPDGSAICGEHLARLGRHEEALAAFLEVPKRGLPVFADGVFYAVERAKLYTNRQTKSQRRLDPAQAQWVFDQLQRFAGLLRRQRPVTTYPGMDVAAPDTSKAPADVTGADALDLSQWFAGTGGSATAARGLQ